MRKLLVPGLLVCIGIPAHAGKLALKLACTTTNDDGKVLKVPARRLRLETPLKCQLVAPPGTAAHAGEVSGDAPFEVTLEPDKDFVGCLDFTIDAPAFAAGSNWTQKVAVKQWCPD